MNNTEITTPPAACWACGSTEHSVWKRRSLDRALLPEDLQITDSRYGQTLTLRKCARCGFLFAADGEVEELVGLYQRLDDAEYETTQDTRLLQMRWLLDLSLAARGGTRTWLDIGAGAGLLVAEARKRGLDAVGIEPSHSLVRAAPKVNGVEILQGIFPDQRLAGRKFDVISLVDVIEHVASPVELLSECAKALAPGGTILLVTPDVGSVLARRLGPRWWHFRLAHVGYFDRDTLRLAAGRAGLKDGRWFRAKWFFRVGYLAERTAEYLPVAWFNRLALRVKPLAWIYDRVIPLNLRDSWVVLLHSAAEGERP